MGDEENRLRHLQKKCSRALALYIDLSEAVCEIMIKSASAPLTPAERARLLELRTQEMDALKGYLDARLHLMTALSVEPFPAYRRMLCAVSAPDKSRRTLD